MFFHTHIECGELLQYVKIFCGDHDKCLYERLLSRHISWRIHLKNLMPSGYEEIRSTRDLQETLILSFV